jgi:gliding motility-associated lipoprotein GldD
MINGSGFIKRIFMKCNFKFLFWGIVLLLFFISCDSDYIPKPRGYFRIDTPEKNYISLDTTLPYSFEYPAFSQISPDPHAPNQKYWINIDYPKFKGRIHISYKKVDNNLAKYLEDSRKLVLKHIPKASSIQNKLINRKEDNVYGLVYNIQGIGAASPYQFYLTDSINHFVRGALYFHTTPNNDSLAPVIKYIISDIDHLIETFQWKTIND